MAESLKLQPLGLQLKIPQVEFTASRVQAQALNELSSNLDRMSGFFFKIAEQRAKVEGAEYGAETAPTQQQIQDAYSKGEEISISGDKFSVYGQSLRNAQLAIVYDELEYLSRNEIASIVKKYNTDVENLSNLSELTTPQINEKLGNLSPNNLKDQLDEVVAGYASTLDNTSPGFARKLRAKMGIVNNSSYVSYADKYVGEINKLNKSVAIANGELIINGVSEQIKGWIEKGEDVDLNLQQMILDEMKTLSMYNVDTVGWNNRMTSAIKETAKQIVVDGLLANGKPVNFLPDMYAGNFNKLPPEIGAAMSLAEKYKIDRYDFIKQVNERVKEAKRIRDENDSLERKENEEKVNFDMSDAIALLGDKNLTSAEELMKPHITAQLKGTSVALKEWKKIVKAYKTAEDKGIKDDPNTIIKLRRKLFSIDKPLTLEELTNEFANQKIGQATFFSMSNQINSLGNQQMSDARSYILDQTNHNPEIRITDPNGDDALKERVFREIMSNVFEAELQAKLDGKPFSAILTAQNLYETKGKELIANRIKFNRKDAVKVLQELATYSELQNLDKELMEKFAKATDQDLDGLLKDALDIAELIIADRKTFGKISINIANAYPSRLSRMFK